MHGRQLNDMKEIKQMLAFMNVDCEITELRLCEPQQENRTRLIVFNDSNVRQRRLILNSLKKLKQYKKSFCVSKELSLAEAQHETQLLRKRECQLTLVLSGRI